jgi:hypothetical protein
MKSEATSELREFHTFLNEKLRNGGAHLSPEEALAEWRKDHPDLEDTEDDLTAIKEALDAVANGDKGVPLDEFDREFRRTNNIPGPP